MLLKALEHSLRILVLNRVDRLTLSEIANGRWFKSEIITYFGGDKLDGIYIGGDLASRLL